MYVHCIKGLRKFVEKKMATAFVRICPDCNTQFYKTEVRMHTSTHLHLQVYVFMYMSIHKCTCICVYICVSVYLHVCILILCMHASSFLSSLLVDFLYFPSFVATACLSIYSCIFFSYFFFLVAFLCSPSFVARGAIAWHVCVAIPCATSAASKCKFQSGTEALPQKNVILKNDLF